MTIIRGTAKELTAQQLRLNGKALTPPMLSVLSTVGICKVVGTIKAERGRAANVYQCDPTYPFTLDDPVQTLIEEATDLAKRFSHAKNPKDREAAQSLLKVAKRYGALAAQSQQGNGKYEGQERRAQ